MNIWKSSPGRAKFRRLLWHKSRENSDIVDVGFFDEKEEEYRNSNPEWFQEDESDIIAQIAAQGRRTILLRF